MNNKVEKITHCCLEKNTEYKNLTNKAQLWSSSQTRHCGLQKKCNNITNGN